MELIRPQQALPQERWTKERCSSCKRPVDVMRRPGSSDYLRNPECSCLSRPPR